uniref:Uncharacterized protein LOC111122356 isoform X2 n=1 Tax=Crassostrea virginica TaxID=6565 RepID=A0A8B8CW52_CRAVI|nr:uncharacterized protein LOC111122356 isoform X2 [Crassostrea virginica]
MAVRENDLCKSRERIAVRENNWFSKNKEAEKYYKELHSLGISVNFENEASRQLYKSSTNCPRHRILLKRSQIDRTTIR